MKTKIISLLVANLISFSFLANAQVSFTPSDTLHYYGITGLVQYGDLDTDGFTDYYFKQDNRIMVSYGMNDGSFSSITELYNPGSQEIYGVSNIVDINGDQYPDFAYLTKNLVTVLIGTAEGFQEHLMGSFYTYHGVIKWVDFNKDGKIDIVTENQDGIWINTNWENDLSNFELILDTGYAYSFEVMDINLDGIQDILTYGEEYTTFYLQNESDQLEEIYRSDVFIYRITSGDINMDTYIDFVYNNNNELYSLVYDPLENTFDKLNITSDKQHYNLTSPILLDIDNNNSLDVVFQNGFGAISYLPNAGGTFQPTVDIMSNGESVKNISSIYGEDINNDNNMDLIVRSISDLQISLLNESQEVIDTKFVSLYPFSTNVKYMDMNNDGFSDIVTLGLHGSITIRWGDQNNEFAEVTNYRTLIYSSELTLWDLNGDDLLDIIFFQNAPDHTNNLYVLYNTGNHQFEKEVKWKYLPSCSDSKAIDINNDGIEELCFLSSPGEIVWFDPLNNDELEYLTTENKIDLSSIYAIDFLIEDMDDNGYDDFIVHHLQQKISIINQDANGFSEMVITLDFPSLDIDLIDIDSDNQPELLVTGSVDNIYYLYVFSRAEDGSYSVTNTFNLGQNYTDDIYVFDVDGDQDDDILIGIAGNYKTFMLENENEVFTLPTDITFGVPTSVERFFADVNGDGLIDALSLNSQGNNFLSLNNSVIQPSIDQLSVTVEDIKHDRIRLVFSETNHSGKLVVISTSPNISEIPTNNEYYTSSVTFGNGGVLGGGNVVMSSNEGTIDIKGLNSRTKYYTHVFEYNQNSPQNTIVNYSSEYYTASFTTEDLALAVDFSVTIEDIKHDRIRLVFHEPNRSGKLVIISTSPDISEIPTNNASYTSSAMVGNGAVFGGGHVVMFSNEETIDINGLNSNTEYYVHVFGYYQNSPENTIVNYSSEYYTASFTTEDFILNTDVDNMIFTNQRGVWPNPADGQLNFNWPYPNESVEVIIGDLNGKIHYKEKLMSLGINMEHSISTDNLQTGLYIIMIKDNLNTLMQKLLIK